MSYLIRKIPNVKGINQNVDTENFRYLITVEPQLMTYKSLFKS